MRQRDHLGPEATRELAAIDRALAGEAVDADLRELEDLVLDIRASAPQMTPAFAARLEHEIAAGFPRQPQRATPRHRSRWMLLPAAATLAAVAIALVVVIAPSGKEQAVTDNATSARTEPAAAAEASGAGARLSAAPPPVTTADRKVQRDALLVLETSADKVQSTADAVIRAVDRFGGIVQSSSSASSDGSAGEATFDLRIPTDRLDEALAALSKLAHVGERSQSLQDVTASFTSAQDRVADARAERRGLLRALGRAATAVRIESLRSRLRLVRSTIARLDGELRSLRRRADLATVQLTVRGSAKSDDGAAGGRWTPGDAARDAVRVLEVIAGIAVIVLAIAVPFALLGAAVAVGVRSGRRRRRDAALDGA